MTNQSLREEWLNWATKMIIANPEAALINSTALIADFWLTRRDEEMKDLVEKVRYKLGIVRDDMTFEGSIGYEKAALEVVSLLEEKLK